MSKREILFKAKRIDDGEWVEGYLWSKRTIGCISPCGHTEEIVIDPETVCQYTGLKDNSGNKIFEGDIVDMSEEWWNAYGPAGHDSPIEPVVWNEYISGFCPFANYDCDCGVYIDAGGCKITGNIYDK